MKAPGSEEILTERIDRVLAHCEDCNRHYRVPHADHTYRCKACGGTVRVSTAEPSSRQANVPEVHLVSEEVREERREASRLLKRGYKWIAGVTWVYRLGTLVYAGITLIAVLALSSPNVPLEDGKLVVAVSGVLTVLMLMGAVHILFAPFVWTLLIAIGATAVAVVHYVGPDPLGVMFLGTVVWAVVLWAAVPVTLWFRGIIGEHKDQYILHHASQRTRHSLENHSSDEKHERLLRAMGRAWKRAWKISLTAAVAVVLAATFGTRAVIANMRPAELAPSVDVFQNAWNSADFDAMAACLKPEIRDEKAVWLRGVADGHGWKTVLPRTSAYQMREEEDCVWVDHELADPDLHLSTCWAVYGLDWDLIQFDLTIPPIEGTLERFLQAWKESDPEKLAAFVPAEFEEGMLLSIQRSASLRDWDDYAEILATEHNLSPDGETIVLLSIESGNVTTKWHFRKDGVWSLLSLRFPKLKAKQVQEDPSGGSPSVNKEENEEASEEPG